MNIAVPRNLIWVCVLAFPLIARAADTPPTTAPAGVDPKADAILRQMGKALAEARLFTVESHAAVERMLESGQQVQTTRNQQLTVRRPDGLYALVSGDADVEFVYDGKTVSLLNRRTSEYASVAAPGDIDKTLDMLAHEHGMALPLAYLLFADPYATLVANLRSGVYLGTAMVFQTRCHHLAFRQPGADWHIWIDQGDKPFPRKVAITYKDLPGQPQYEAFLSSWHVLPAAPPGRFEFVAQPGARKVELSETRPAEPPLPPQPPK